MHSKDEILAFSLGNELSDGICLSDKNGVIIDINNEYSRILNISKKEIIGKNLNYLKDKGIIENPIQFEVIKRKKKLSRIINIEKNNNIALVTAIPIFNGNNVEKVLTVFRDLTEINNFKKKLQKVNSKNIQHTGGINELEGNIDKDDKFIGQSNSIKKLKKLIEVVAKTDATVLITGETGCGKEVLANEIYEKSTRIDKPYIKINCAAIPEALIESELFGYEQGAFTGAQNKRKIGMFEAANGGTILLDEIGEMPVLLQSKLLRVLQEKELVRIGGIKPVKLDIRVIAATNQNLEELVEKKKFREDLYYRLNVIPIHIPPLRERKDDILLLTNKFLSEYNEKYNKQLYLDNKAIDILKKSNWLGNVRELKNAIEMLVILCNGDNVDIEILKSRVSYKEDIEEQLQDNTLNFKNIMERVEKNIIKEALEKYGSTYKAAENLGINQSSVYRKAKYYELIK